MQLRACTINLTNACNMNCSYCFRYGIDKKEDSLTEEALIEQLEFFFREAKFRHCEIGWWGGEPFLEWKLMRKGTKLAREIAKKYNKTVNFGGTTNGTLLTPEKFDFLDKEKIYFMVTIDGIKEIHDKNRVFKNGSGSFDLIVRNLTKVLKRWPFYMIRMSTTREGILNLKKSFQTMYDYGVRHFYHSPVHEEPASFQEYYDAYMETALWLIDKRNEDPNISWKHIDEGCRALLYGFSDTRPCGAGLGYIGFSTDGAIYPCHRFIKSNRPDDWREDKYVIGHVKHGWLNDKFRMQFERWEDFMKEVNSPCFKCEVFNKIPCKGGCFATNMDLEGEIWIPNKSICDNAKATLKVCEELIKISKSDNTVRILPNQMELETRRTIRGGAMKGCICNNMCYMEGTGEQIIKIDPSMDGHCVCYNEYYAGSLEENVARPLTREEIEKHGIKSEDIGSVIADLKSSIDNLSKLIEQLVKKNAT